MNPTLEPAEGGCRHVETGTLLEGDPADGVDDACYDATGAPKTTLAAPIDEDAGLRVDDDDDGLFDEDGPSAPPPGFAADCRRLGTEAGLPVADAEAMVTPDGGCDLTSVIVKKVNDKVGKKAFKTDDPNAPPEDPDAPPIDYGAEERSVSLTEEVTITCEEGMALDEATGLCVDTTRVAALAEARAGCRSADLPIHRSIGREEKKKRDKIEIKIWAFRLILVPKTRVTLTGLTISHIPSYFHMKRVRREEAILAQSKVTTRTKRMGPVPRDMWLEIYRHLSLYQKIKLSTTCRLFHELVWESLDTITSSAIPCIQSLNSFLAPELST